MATASYKEDIMQILAEMRQLFPKVPEHIIQSSVSQYQSDKTACCRLLEMYASPNRNFLDKSTAGLYGKMELPLDGYIDRQRARSPSSNRSQSFSGAGATGTRDNITTVPQSAPIGSNRPFSHPEDAPPPYSSYYAVHRDLMPSQQSPSPQNYHVSTLEIPPRHTSRVDMELTPPTQVSPHFSISISTNGPAFSQSMQRQWNANYKTASSSPRKSPRPQASPTAANDREAFVQALLSYQGVRYKQLYRELARSQDTLQKLQREVSSLEESLKNGTTNGGNMNSTSADVLRSMRNEITKLRVECHCLSVEADICMKEQNQQGGDFYQNIFTGQVGPIPPVPASDNNGNQVEDNEGSKWKCFACTFLNHPALNSCEVCEMPRKIID